LHFAAGFAAARGGGAEWIVRTLSHCAEFVRGLASTARMQITRQLAVFLENRPGMLARVCDALAAEKINIYGVSSSDTVDHIVIRLVVSDPVRAMRLFEDRGVLVVANEVLMIESTNKPGSLAEIAHKLAKAKINIEYAYCATPPKEKHGLLILRASDPKKALKVLNR
jgi:hypothetical protein